MNDFNEAVDIHLPVLRVHYDFRPIKIRVYRNGDENDLGKDIYVTRKEFKHWIVFLDALTKKLGTTTAINRLYTIGGLRVDNFDDLQPQGEYVAVERTGYIACEYGKYRRERGDKTWKVIHHLEDQPTPFLNSAETMDIYLKNEGYGSCTGLPYPFDSVLAKSPSNSAMHIHSHANMSHHGGSMERLNKVGRPLWESNGIEHNSLHDSQHSRSAIQLPKLIGLEDAMTGEEQEKEKQPEATALPRIEKNERQSTEESNKEATAKGKDEKMNPEGNSMTKTGILKDSESKENTEIKKREIKIEESPERKPQDERKQNVEEKEERNIVPLLLLEKREINPSKKTKIPFPNHTTKPSFSSSHFQQPVSIKRDSSYDVDLEDEKPVRKGRGVEKIFERTERRIIRELSDDSGDVYKPSRIVTQDTSNFKTYLWEARKFDPDFD